MSGIFKQLVIKSLVDAEELQEEIMSYVFEDQKERSRRIKDKMILDMNRNLKYRLAPGNYWGLTYRIWRITIGGQIHKCGDYYAMESGESIPECVKCKCPSMQSFFSDDSDNDY
jgi:hypothetical protein